MCGFVEGAHVGRGGTSGTVALLSLVNARRCIKVCLSSRGQVQNKFVKKIINMSGKKICRVFECGCVYLGWRGYS